MLGLLSKHHTSYTPLCHISLLRSGTKQAMLLITTFQCVVNGKSNPKSASSDHLHWVEGWVSLCSKIGVMLRNLPLLSKRQSRLASSKLLCCRSSLFFFLCYVLDMRNYTLLFILVRDNYFLYCVVWISPQPYKERNNFKLFGTTYNIY